MRHISGMQNRLGLIEPSAYQPPDNPVLKDAFRFVAALDSGDAGEGTS